MLLETLDALLLQMLAKQVSARPSAEDVARRLAQLERGFVEADTFGGAATPIPLTVVAGRPRTSVLTPSNSKRVNPNQSR